MPVNIVVLGEKKHQPYCMSLPTREILNLTPEEIEVVFKNTYQPKIERADLVVVWLPESKKFSDIPSHLFKNLQVARNLKKRIILVWSDKIEEDIAFWDKPFPQLYRCKSCGTYSLMEKPEPWCGHICIVKAASSKLNELGFGEWTPVAYGKDAMQLWTDLKMERKQ